MHTNSLGKGLSLALQQYGLLFFLLQALECLFKAPSVKSFVKKTCANYAVPGLSAGTPAAVGGIRTDRQSLIEFPPL